MALKPEYYSKLALSNSGIKRLLQSPAHFQAWLSAPNKQSKAMIIGELIHYLLLTPELIDEEVRIFGKTKTLESKKAQDFIEANPGKFVCTQDNWDFAEQAAKKVLADRRIVSLLQRPYVQNEHEIYTSINGVKCKALVDSICPSIILDIKSSSDTGSYFKKADGFVDKFFRFGYDIQAAWYQNLAWRQDGRIREVLFLVLEMEDPFATKIVSPRQAAIDTAWGEIERAIELYQKCMENDFWPSYPFTIEYLETPGWKLKKIREEEKRRKEEAAEARGEEVP